MIISAKRSGGFAGLSENLGAVDTAQLNLETAQEIKHKVQAMGFFDLPEMVWGEDIGADMFQYEIMVEDGNRKHAVAFMDADNPETAALRQLLTFITQTATDG